MRSKAQKQRLPLLKMSRPLGTDMSSMGRNIHINLVGRIVAKRQMELAILGIKVSLVTKVSLQQFIGRNPALQNLKRANVNLTMVKKSKLSIILEPLPLEGRV